MKISSYLSLTLVLVSPIAQAQSIAELQQYCEEVQIYVQGKNTPIAAKSELGEKVVFESMIVTLRDRFPEVRSADSVESFSRRRFQILNDESIEASLNEVVPVFVFDGQLNLLAIRSEGRIYDCEKFKNFKLPTEVNVARDIDVRFVLDSGKRFEQLVANPSLRRREDFHPLPEARGSFKYLRIPPSADPSNGPFSKLIDTYEGMMEALINVSHLAERGLVPEVQREISQLLAQHRGRAVLRADIQAGTQTVEQIATQLISSTNLKDRLNQLVKELSTKPRDRREAQRLAAIRRQELLQREKDIQASTQKFETSAENATARVSIDKLRIDIQTLEANKTQIEAMLASPRARIASFKTKISNLNASEKSQVSVARSTLEAKYRTTRPALAPADVKLLTAEEIAQKKVDILQKKYSKAYLTSVREGRDIKYLKTTKTLANEESYLPEAKFIVQAAQRSFPQEMEDISALVDVEVSKRKARLAQVEALNRKKLAEHAQNERAELAAASDKINAQVAVLIAAEQDQLNTQTRAIAQTEARLVTVQKDIERQTSELLGLTRKLKGQSDDLTRQNVALVQAQKQLDNQEIASRQQWEKWLSGLQTESRTLFRLAAELNQNPLQSQLSDFQALNWGVHNLPNFTMYSGNTLPTDIEFERDTDRLASRLNELLAQEDDRQAELRVLHGTRSARVSWLTFLDGRVFRALSVLKRRELSPEVATALKAQASSDFVIIQQLAEVYAAPRGK